MTDDPSTFVVKAWAHGRNTSFLAEWGCAANASWVAGLFPRTRTRPALMTRLAVAVSRPRSFCLGTGFYPHGFSDVGHSPPLMELLNSVLRIYGGMK